MTPQEIERLFREYQPGERVRAIMDIIYGDGGEIPEGTLGVVEATRWHGVRALPLVRWSTGVVKATSTTALDPADPPTPGPCVVCNKERHEDGSPVTWRCAMCGGRVCRDCTMTIPGSRPREYHGLTLCSEACWKAAGSPSD